MEIGEQEAARLRNELHNLDIRDFFDREFYYDKLLYIIASGEGYEQLGRKQPSFRTF